MPARFLETHHPPAIVGVSLLVAVLASYVALDFARRLRSAGVRHLGAWWAGGSLVMGTGIWSMHFIGMLGLEAGIPLAYRWETTLASWVAAVLSSALALGLSRRAQLTPRLLAAGSAAIAAGISAMHYIGMQALVLVPGIDWLPERVAASVLIAWATSAVSLALFFGLRHRHGRGRLRVQAPAALVMGLAIAGMHYTGMAAARLPAGAVCATAGALTGDPLAVMVAVATLLLLGGALALSVADALARARESRLALSLDEARQSLLLRVLEDPLTGLPNRVLFNDRLQQAVQRVEGRSAPGCALAVMLLDIDGFGAINASFGQQAGDRVLAEAACRLREALGADATLARLGSDEFAAFVEAADAEEAAVVQAQRFIQAFAQPFRPEGRVLSLSCSIGIALFPQHDASGHQLLAQADAAAHAARRAGGHTLMVYQHTMAGDDAEQLMLQHALRGAIDRGELMLHYQPTVPARGEGVHGLEALLRWRHPERGFVSPAVFVPLAERFGLIGDLGHWVLEAACAQMARWQAEGRRCRVAINLSPHQLQQAGLPQRIAHTLQRHGLEPARLTCEITESAMMENLPVQRAVLDEIRALGVCISIDDFGTGYSSLAHLRTLPARQLKIDRSFVADLGVDPDARAVLASIVQLAHALRMEVVAEGVETSAQRHALVELGCDVLQGYLIARPMPAEAVLPWLHARCAAEPALAG